MRYIQMPYYSTNGKVDTFIPLNGSCEIERMILIVAENPDSPEEQNITEGYQRIKIRTNNTSYTTILYGSFDLVEQLIDFLNYDYKEEEETKDENHRIFNLGKDEPMHPSIFDKIRELNYEHGC